MPFVVEKAWFETYLSRRIVRPSDRGLIVQKQGGEVVNLVQKTFRDFTTDIDESHSLSSRASLAYDLLLAATSKEITRKTRVHTWGLSPTNTHTNSGTVPEFVPEFVREGKPDRSEEATINGLSDVARGSDPCVPIAATSQTGQGPALR